MAYTIYMTVVLTAIEGQHAGKTMHANYPFYEKTLAGQTGDANIGVNSKKSYTVCLTVLFTRTVEKQGTEANMRFTDAQDRTAY